MIDFEKINYEEFCNLNKELKLEMFTYLYEDTKLKKVVFDGKDIGVISLERYHDGCLIVYFSINKDFRRKNKGTEIIKEFLKNIKGKVYLVPEDPGVELFWRSIGFEFLDKQSNMMYMEVK